MYSLYHFPNINFAKIKKVGVETKEKQVFSVVSTGYFLFLSDCLSIFVCEVAFSFK